jgi:hypothetical protein
MLLLRLCAAAAVTGSVALMLSPPKTHTYLCRGMRAQRRVGGLSGHHHVEGQQPGQSRLLERAHPAGTASPAPAAPPAHCAAGGAGAEARHVICKFLIAARSRHRRTRRIRRTQLTYVDESGGLVSLDAVRDAEALGDFINSAGMMGVVVEVVLRCRPRRPIRSVITVIPGGSGLARRLLEMRQRCDNLFAIVKPAASAAASFAYVEQRHATHRTSKPLWCVAPSDLRSSAALHPPPPRRPN